MSNRKYKALWLCLRRDTTDNVDRRFIKGVFPDDEVDVKVTSDDDFRDGKTISKFDYVQLIVDVKFHHEEGDIEYKRDYIEHYWSAPIKGVLWIGNDFEDDFEIPDFLKDSDVNQKYITNFEGEEKAILAPFSDFHLKLAEMYVHHERAIVNPQFKLYDTDGSASIDAQELGNLMRDFKINLSKSDVYKALRDMDTNGDG